MCKYGIEILVSGIDFSSAETPVTLLFLRDKRSGTLGTQEFNSTGTKLSTISHRPV